MGGINFLYAGAAVADLIQSKELGCLQINGFVGWNLIRKAVWKFDYLMRKNKLLRYQILLNL